VAWHLASQTYKSLYILGVHEDDEKIFMLRFFTQNVFFFMFSNCEVLFLLGIFCWSHFYILFTIHKLGKLAWNQFQCEQNLKHFMCGNPKLFNII
jgi:hypothetical protein